ncbi:MAG: TolB family protein [Halioglobus sp.]
MKMQFRAFFTVLMVLCTGAFEVLADNFPSELSDCDNTTSANGGFDTSICWVGGDLVPPPEHATGPLPNGGMQPIAISKHNHCSGKLQLQLFLPGSNPVPTNNTKPDLSSQGCKVAVNVGPGHWPDVALWGGNMDQGAHYFSDNYWRRVRWAVSLALEAYLDEIDFGAGGQAFCLSIGANTCMAMLMNMEEGELETPIANWMTNYFMINGITMPEKVLEGRPLAAAQMEGYDVERLSFEARAASGMLDNKYLRIDCSSDDFKTRAPSCDPEIIELANKHGIHLVMTVTAKQHNIDCNQYNLPCTERYPHGEGDAYRPDSVYVAIVNSTANRMGDVGHNNLGLYFDHDHEYQPGRTFVTDSVGGLVLPFKYEPLTDIGFGVDQPNRATFDTVIRNSRKFKILKERWYRWRFYSSTQDFVQGYVQAAENGELKIEGLSIDAFDGKTLVIQRSGLPADLLPQNPAIVYTEQPRSGEPVPGTPLESAGNWDHAWDVGRLMGGMAESDVILDYLNGVRQVIHSCTNSPKICFADDAKVSPDGTKVAFTECLGDQLVNVKAFFTPYDTGGKDIQKLTECRLWMYDIAADTKTRLTAGHMDRTPEWLNNNTLVFASDRAGDFVPWNPVDAVHPGKHYPHHGFHIYRADIAGNTLTNFENLTPHESMALNPEVLTTGEIVYSAYMGGGVRGKFNTSPRNAWYIARMDANGANGAAELGFHESPVLEARTLLPNVDPTRRGTDSGQKALRGVAETSRGKLKTGNYYRNNHTGMGGDIYCHDDDPGEGVLRAADVAGAAVPSTTLGSGHFAPSTLRNCTPFAESQDAAPKYRNTGQAYGKAGYPAAHTNAPYMFTWFRGSCYAGAFEWNTVTEHGGELPCHRVIALAHVEQITDPFYAEQVSVISSDPGVHRWGAQQVTTYESLYGQPLPTQIPRLDAFGQTSLAVVNMKAHGSFAIPGKESKEERETFSGNVDANYTTDVAEFCTTYVQPKKTLPTEFGYDHLETTCSPLQADNSVNHPVDPDRVFLMHARDAWGNDLAFDHSPHSLRKGEQRCCMGCHLGHDEPNHTDDPCAAFDSTNAAR